MRSIKGLVFVCCTEQIRQASILGVSTKSMQQQILGIDPGSIKTGYALLSFEGKKAEILKSGTIKLNPKADFFLRLKELQKELEALLKDVGPFDLAVESLIHVKNVNSLAKLSQARGVILSEALKKDACVFEYSPNLIKSSVSGYGHSSKESVEKALRFLFPKHVFSSHDESDALAIALCHSLHYNSRTATSLEKRPEGSHHRSDKRQESQNRGSKKKSSSLKNAFKHLDV